MGKGGPKQLHLSEVSERCRQESARFRAGVRGEEGWCLELFRRALESSDEEAWNAIHAQYRDLIVQWAGGGSQGQDLVGVVLAKFWRSLGGVDLSRRFGHVGAVLAYLRKCAFSVRMDDERSQKRQERELALDEVRSLGGGDAQQAALKNLSLNDCYDALRRWLDENLQSEAEREVVHLSFELGLSPSEIAQRHPDRYDGVREVHRIKERVLKRIRRSEMLRELQDLYV